MDSKGTHNKYPHPGVLNLYTSPGYQWKNILIS